MPPTAGDTEMAKDVVDSVRYLQSLQAIRHRCNEILGLAEDGRLSNFTMDLSKLKIAEDMIISLIERDYGQVDEKSLQTTLKVIPPHGRWRHFGSENIERLMKELTITHGDDKRNITRSILDLFVVAVLLDAGAGDAWKLKDGEKVYSRSEGLAVASLRMFERGKFSSVGGFQVDSVGLLSLKESDIITGFQVKEGNPLLGVTGRLELLHRLGMVLEEKTGYFPKDSNGSSRPGNLLDYLLTHQTGNNQINIDTLWEVIINGFGGVWPESRTKLAGVSLGDVWPSVLLGKLVPFHKLSQWLTYSLMEPINQLMNIKIVDADKMTGLAEYRNGGLFVDLDIMKLNSVAYENGIAKAKELGTDSEVPIFSPDSQVIVEWRALTVSLIDRLAESIRCRLSVSADELPLPKLLEAGTWKAGREIAKQLRATGGPPIAIISDGTLF